MPASPAARRHAPAAGDAADLQVVRQDLIRRDAAEAAALAPGTRISAQLVAQDAPGIAGFKHLRRKRAAADADPGGDGTVAVPIAVAAPAATFPHNQRIG